MDSPIVLVVDDEPLNLDIIEEFLTGKGQPYIVETATDGIEAMEKLEADPNHYDVVLLDRMMPRMSGMEVLEQINKVQMHLEIVPA